MIGYDELIALKNSDDFIRVIDGNRPYYGGSQDWIKEEINRKVGCSIITAANITAYLAKYHKAKDLYGYEDMSKDNYIKHVEILDKYIPYDDRFGLISTISFTKSIENYAKDKGVKLKAYWISIEESLEKIKEFIQEALKKNAPLALLMMRNSRVQCYDWHWMTITKLFKNGESTLLHVSTWGEKKVIKLEEVYYYSAYGTLSYFLVE